MCYLYVEKKKLPQKSGSFSVPSIKSGFIEIPPECAGEIDNFSLRYDAVEAQSSAD